MEKDKKWNVGGERNASESRKQRREEGPVVRTDQLPGAV